VVVAAVGNGPQSPAMPWKFADYPAALPHVIGVSAVRQDGTVPDYSNRDAVFNDLAAPGAAIFSTIPRQLTDQTAECADRPYSDCGSDEFRQGIGTSFAAPQVSAAAAQLFAANPILTNGQVASLLEHSADDVNAANGCGRCALLRDPLSGWGRLDVAKAVQALAGPLPPADLYETNDDAGTQARTMWGKHVKINATVDYYDDQIDVYRIALSGGERINAKLAGGWPGASVSLVLWRPGTRRVDDLRTQALRAAQSIAPGSAQSVTFKAPGRGWYYVEVKVTAPGYGPYTLTLVKTAPLP
jgi:subtilisin family serine protease